MNDFSNLHMELDHSPAGMCLQELACAMKKEKQCWMVLVGSVEVIVAVFEF